MSSFVNFVISVMWVDQQDHLKPELESTVDHFINYVTIKNVTLVLMSLHWDTTFSVNTSCKIEMILIYPIMFPSLNFVVPVF